jgi:hypothetical protein
MKTYTVHGVRLFSLFKTGFIIGLVFSCLPVTVLTVTFFRLVQAVENWLSGLVYNLRLPLIGEISINVVDLLRLQAFYASLQRWSLWGGIPTVLAVLALLVGLAGVIGLLTALAGLLFNLLSRASGGIQVDVSESPLLPKE